MSLVTEMRFVLVDGAGWLGRGCGGRACGECVCVCVCVCEHVVCVCVGVRVFVCVYGCALPELLQRHMVQGLAL